MGALMSVLCGDSAHTKEVKKHELDNERAKVYMNEGDLSNIDTEVRRFSSITMKRCGQKENDDENSLKCKVAKRQKWCAKDSIDNLHESHNDSNGKRSEGSSVDFAILTDVDKDSSQPIKTLARLTNQNASDVDKHFVEDNYYQIYNNDKGFNINQLPTSVLLQILQHLSLQDLIKRAALVCKRWHELCFDPDLWHTVPLKGQMKVDDTILERFTNYSGSIHFLDLTDVRLITSEGLKNTLSYCFNLRKLYLTRCMHLNDTAFGAIGEYCHFMKQLKLDCCSALTDQALEKIGAGCPRLEKLWLNQCSSIRDPGIIAVTRGCPRLKLLTVEQCRDITDAILEPLAAGCPDLESLGFMSNNITTKGIKHLAKCKLLRILEMTQMDGIDDDCIMHVIQSCPYLNTLNVSLCTSVSDKAVRYIAEHGVSMRSLYMVACKLTDQALFSLAEFSKTIEKVDVGWCEEITGDGAEAISRNCHNLQYLGLMRCDKVTKETSERLVNTYPQISYSTMWLECERLLEKARLAGYMVA